MSANTVQLSASASDGLTAHVTIDLTAGGRVRSIRLVDDAESVDLLAKPSDDAASSGWGSFPMAPWAGRIRNGRFRFLGRTVNLDLNHSDDSGIGGGPIDPPRSAPSGPIHPDDRHRHAIHGTTFHRPWQVVTRTPQRVEMICSIDGTLGWPYAGVARQVVELSPERLELQLSVEAADHAVFPAAVGWHPWFVKPAALDFHPVAMYARDDLGLPTGELVTPRPAPWDDCFVNHEPVELHYTRGLGSCIRVSSPDCEYWVLYDKPEHATCVEPQSGPPDALNLRPEVVTPDRPLRRTMTIAWS